MLHHRSSRGEPGATAASVVCLDDRTFTVLQYSEGNTLGSHRSTECGERIAWPVDVNTNVTRCFAVLNTLHVSQLNVEAVQIHRSKMLGELISLAVVVNTNSLRGSAVLNTSHVSQTKFAVIVNSSEHCSITIGS